MAKSPSYSSVMQPCFCYALCDLVTLCTLSLRPRYDQGVSAVTVLFRHIQPWRFCHASATLMALFKCSPKDGVAHLDSRTNSKRFHSHVIEECKAIYLPCSMLLLVGHSAHIVAVCLRIIMDGPRTFWTSDSDLPGPPNIQHNMSVVHNGQLKNSDLSASIVGIQLNINQLNFRFYIEKLQKRNKSVAPSSRS